MFPLRNLWANGHGTWYAVLGTWVHYSLFTWWTWTWVDLGPILWSNLALYGFVWGKVKTANFSGNIIHFVMKLASMGQMTKGTCICWYKNSALRGYLSLPHGSVRLSVVHTLQTSLKPLAPFKPNCIWSLHGCGEQKFVPHGHQTKVAKCPYTVKTL